MSPDRVEAGSAADRTIPISPAPAVGQVLADRYRVERLLGRGGMGEVWQAFDLKLQVDVALKFLRPEVASDSHRIELLRREVRSARNVASPHVCRVFDLVEIDRREVVAMEYIDGTTLESVLSERSPLDLAEARRLAAQLLSGLDAIHGAGLIHRDLKPANVMITRSGRVVIMDFGLAKSVAETQSAVLAGTPAYMAPEQMRGEELDARADLYAVGLILAEMVAPGGVRDPDSRRRVWETLRADPPAAPPGAWESPIRRAVAAERGARFASAAELARALGDGGPRTGVAEDLSPYPGLVAFTEAQARYFFGREMDVESIWRKLQRSSMIALIGPSGVGKSSFLRAGLYPARPDDWGMVICTPGDSPFTALGRAFVSEFEGRTEAMRDLFRLQEIERSIPLLHGWRQRHRQAVLVLDQFEELFTQNSPEVQSRFSDLLGRISVEADIRVLVSMRDDFFFLCHQYPALRPLFSETSPLAPISAQDLRRALVEPARLCGYAFEDDALVDAMLAEVESERGALPLLAFAAARIWERRDRERGVISRQAYEDIGRVGGALAQHAEATLEAIGREREDLVRELFRNLVTAQNTRLVREREELLSVFPDRAAAETVLKALIDARLLTSFEIQETKADTRQQHRIEIVHESLLTSWPRLVRWQTQDVEGAQLRDQLRLAAQLWTERNRSDDLLWTGTAYQEFELWRERYPGGLTETESAFAEAMESRALRGRRRRRFALSASFAILLAVLAVFGTLWQRANRMNRISEARRLHMLAQDAIETDNTLALALATASLEREDDPAVRRVALTALWHAPVYSELNLSDTLNSVWSAVLSPDGEWVATAEKNDIVLRPRDGGTPRRFASDAGSAAYKRYEVNFHPDGHFLVHTAGNSEDPRTPYVYTLCSAPDGRRLWTWKFHIGYQAAAYSYLRGDPPRLLVAEEDDPKRPYRWLRFSPDRDEPEELGRADTSTEQLREFTVDPTGRYLLDYKGTELYLFPLDSLGTPFPIHVGSHDHDILGVNFDRTGNLVISADKLGEIRLWSRGEDGRYSRLLRHQTETNIIRVVGLDNAASRIVHAAQQITQLRLIDRAMPEAQSTLLLARPGYSAFWWQFTPDDSCMVARRGTGLLFYSLAKRRPHIFQAFREENGLWPYLFLHGGTQLVAWKVPNLWLCDLKGFDPEPRLLWTNPSGRTTDWITADPQGRYLLANSVANGEAYLIPLDGSPVRTLGGFDTYVSGVALSPDARRAAVGGGIRYDFPDAPFIRVWDLETGEVQVLKSPGKSGFFGLWFLPGNKLLSSGKDGLFLWDLGTGEYEVLNPGLHDVGELDGSRRHFVIRTSQGPMLWDLVERTHRPLPKFGKGATSVAFAPDARFVAVGKDDGSVWVLPLDTLEPHLLLGHKGPVDAVWIPPESDRIYSAGEDGTVRIWELPQGKPVHTLPRAEFLQLLRSQTNLRIVLDPKAENGYRTSLDRFPGWEKAPTW